MPDKRVHVIVRGRVQGVFFRSETQKTAFRYNVRGWVRNCDNGNVEAVFEGKEEDVDRVVLWCHEGPAFASVTAVEIKNEPFIGEFTSFLITA